jgi:hypothetical protein
MIAEDLAKRIAARPFEPMLVQMRDGRTFEIRRTGMAIVTPTTLVLGIARANGSRLAERIVRCALDEIVSVEPAAAPR